MRRKSREYAVQALYALDLNPLPLPDFLKLFWEMNSTKEDIQNYATDLIRGTLERKKEILDPDPVLG